MGESHYNPSHSMRFEVAYKSGTRHEVQLAKSVVVLGRDPGCDIVLNDTKCSRRHAVVEDRPEGLLIRDCGSANGIHVNGRRLEMCLLRPGDTVRLGDVTLTLMVEIGDTVVVAPPDLDPMTMPVAPRPSPEHPREASPEPASAPSSRPSRPHRSRPPAASAPSAARRPTVARPLTVTLLAALWAIFVPCAVAATLASAWRAGAGLVGWAAAAAISLVAAGVGVAMVVGMRSLAAWARHLQIAAAAVGLVVCPFALASATVLLYMAKPEVKASFETPDRPGPAGLGSAEPTFALSIVAMLLLGIALSAAAVLLVRPGR